MTSDSTRDWEKEERYGSRPEDWPSDNSASASQNCRSEQTFFQRHKKKVIAAAISTIVILLVIAGVGYHLTEKRGQDTTLSNVSSNGLEGSKAQLSSFLGEDSSTISQALATGLVKESTTTSRPVASVLPEDSTTNSQPAATDVA